MENLELDLGAVEYRIQGGGVLRFNPADPNLYARFLDRQRGMEQIWKHFRQKAKTVRAGDQVLALLQEADLELKKLLESVFPGNDFQAALGGINLLAVGGNGKTVAENLLIALEQILSRGAQFLVETEAARLQQ